MGQYLQKDDPPDPSLPRPFCSNCMHCRKSLQAFQDGLSGTIGKDMKLRGGRPRAPPEGTRCAPLRLANADREDEADDGRGVRGIGNGRPVHIARVVAVPVRPIGVTVVIPVGPSVPVVAPVAVMPPALAGKGRRSRRRGDYCRDEHESCDDRDYRPSDFPDRPVCDSHGASNSGMDPHGGDLFKSSTIWGLQEF